MVCPNCHSRVCTCYQALPVPAPPVPGQKVAFDQIEVGDLIKVQKSDLTIEGRVARVVNLGYVETENRMYLVGRDDKYEITLLERPVKEPKKHGAVVEAEWQGYPQLGRRFFARIREDNYWVAYNGTLVLWSDLANPEVRFEGID